jgi:hypothetical protein
MCRYTDDVLSFFLQNKIYPFLAHGICIYVGHSFLRNTVGPISIHICDGDIVGWKRICAGFFIVCLTLPQHCACPKPGPEFPTSYFVVFVGSVNPVKMREIIPDTSNRFKIN